MRVIGGEAKGRRLKLPKELDIRPTADRVREAMFDVLEHLDLIDDAVVGDLFSGTGALGIEAASRGARSVVFVDSDRVASSVIEGNIEATAVRELCPCRVSRSEALAWCRSGREELDVCFVDPPYAYDQWEALLAVVPAAFLVLESNREIELPERFELHRHYRYGTTLVTMAQRRPEGGAPRTS